MEPTSETGAHSSSASGLLNCSGRSSLDSPFESRKTCPFCKRRYRRSSEVFAHVRLVHRAERGSRHLHDDRAGTRKRTSNRPSRTQPEEKEPRVADGQRYSCTYCDKEFGSSGRLKTHVWMHFGVRPCPCTSCSERLKSPGASKVRKRIQTGGEAYTCARCHRKFCSPTSHRAHVKRQSCKAPSPEAPEAPEAPRRVLSRALVCRSCGKVSLDWRGEEVFRCGLCGSVARADPHAKPSRPISFAPLLRWMQELRAEPPGALPSDASEASAVLESAAHQSRPSDAGRVVKRYSSAVRGFVTRMRAMDTDAMSSASSSCSYADAAAPRAPPAPTSYQCSFCLTSFTLRVFLESHMRIHVKKAYVCRDPACGLRFPDHQSRTAHFVKHH